MSIGNFNETNDSGNEVRETNESTDNNEKSRNQILETTDSYDDDFDSKLDSAENNESKTEKNDNVESKSDEKSGEEKQSLLDKMRNLFSRKERDNESESDPDDSDNTEASSNDFSSKRNSFLESLREGAPSTEEQAEIVKKWKEDSKNEYGTDSGENSDDARSKEHGEDGERTRWSDAQWAREHERE